MSHLANPLALRLGVVTFWNSVWSSNIIKKYNFFFFEDFIFFDIFNWLFVYILKKFGYIFSHIKILRTFDNIIYFLVFFYNSFLEKKWMNFFRFFSIQSFFRKSLDNYIFSLLDLLFPLLNWEKNIIGVNRVKKYIILLKNVIKKRKKKFRYFFSKGSLFSLYFIFSYYASYYKNSLNLNVSALKCLFQTKIASLKFKIINFVIQKKINLNYSCKLAFYHVASGSLNSDIIGNYLITKLSQRFKLFKIVDPLLRTLNQLEFLRGFKIACSGRFTRKQIATYYWEKSGKLPLNEITQFIDYKFLTVTLKNSICGIKIWLCYPLKIYKLKELLKNAIILNSVHE